jgi:hypothetical protein
MSGIVKGTTVIKKKHKKKEGNQGKALAVCQSWALLLAISINRFMSGIMKATTRIMKAAIGTKKKHKNKHQKSEAQRAAACYKSLGNESKALTVSQPWALLLVCGIKRFEGRVQSIRYLEANDFVWICSSAKMMGFASLKQTLESTCSKQEMRTLCKFLQVKEITQENYKKHFLCGKVLGRVQFDAKCSRAEYGDKKSVPVEHSVVYPVVCSQALAEAHYWDVKGYVGSAFQIAGSSVLMDYLL